MGVFAKLAGLMLVVGGGSLAALWLAFVNVPLAVVALAAMLALAIGWIVLITRADQVRR